MNKVERKIDRTVQLAKNVRLHRADGGETDPALNQDTSIYDNPYKDQVLSAPEPMTLGQYLAQAMRKPHETNIRDFPQDFQNLAVVQGIKQLPHQMLEAVKYPGMALKGELQRGIDPHTGQVTGVTESGMGPTEAGMVGAGLMTTGALPDVLAGRVTPNVSRVFAGPLSNTADLAALEKAQAMAAQGAEHSDILKQTGWFQGADNKWRYEIPDIGSKVISDTGSIGPLETYMEHPALYEAYPRFKDITTVAQASPPKGRESLGGSYSPDSNIMKVYGTDPEKSRSTALHEIQHAIQTMEGFAPGSSSQVPVKKGTPAWDIYKDWKSDGSGKPMSREEWFKSPYTEKTEDAYQSHVKSQKNVDRALKEEAAIEAYKRSAGEVESRNVQARRNMTPEELRQSEPWKTQDMPYYKQIVSPPLEANGGRVGFADGGSPPWGFDFNQPTIDFQPQQPPVPPLADLNLYTGAPLNKPPVKPEDEKQPQTTDDMSGISSPGGAGGENSQAVTSAPDFALEMGPQMSEGPSPFSGLATAAGFGPGVTAANTVGGLFGGLLGTAVAGPFGGLVGGLIGRHAANAISAQDEDEDSEDDDGEDDGDDDNGSQSESGGLGPATDASPDAASQTGAPDSSAESATANMQDGGAITVRRYRANGGPIKVSPSHTEAGPSKISPAQAKAGNYKKKHLNFQGLPLAIETPKGHVREKVINGKVDWRVKMPVDYGYVKGTKDNDGDATDVFVGPHKDSDKVWVIDQADHHTGKFDEHKAMLGFKHKHKAIKAYKNSFSDGKAHKRIMDATKMSVDEYKDWIKHGNLKKPVSSSPFIQKALMVASKKS